MPKRATVQPDWLDDMLFKWGQRLPTRGYPSVCPQFRERMGSPARSYEPTGYGDEDFRQLEAAIDRLDTRYRLVITAYYKPWTAKDIFDTLKGEYSVTERTMRNWLHDAARLIAADMDKQQEVA